MKVYYDTYPAIAFIANREFSNLEYSPFNTEVEPLISFLTLEEALHILFAKEKYKEKWYPSLSKEEAFDEFITDILSSYSFVSLEEVTRLLAKYKTSIEDRLLEIVNLLNVKHNFIGNIGRKKLPGFMDLFHFILADLTADIIVTTDSTFRKLESIKTIRLKKIVILNEETLEVDDIILFD